MLLEGTVTHARLAEPSSSTAAHAFGMRVWMALVDLQDLDSGTAFPPGSRVVSDAAHHRAIACWRRADHFGDADEPLSSCALRVFRERLPGIEVHRVLLLTNLSTLGMYNFNPVSVYYGMCGDTVKAVLLEVSNTPWLDKRIYALALDAHGSASWAKDFHVSPFMDGQHDYHWTLSSPLAPVLDIKAVSSRRPLCASFSHAWTADHVRGAHPVAPVSSSLGAPRTFVVTLQLRRVEDEWRAVARNPIMPLSAVLQIHVHALIVALKGAPYVLPPPGARRLGARDLVVHLVVFFIASLGWSVSQVARLARWLLTPHGTDDDE